MDLGLKGKRALVLASSAGLGKAVACELSKEGARVVISSRNECRLADTKQEVKAEGFLVADLATSSSAKQLVQDATEMLGGLDILVTNAGGPPAANFEEIGTEQWRNSFEELFIAVTEAVEAAIPVMKSQGFGRIVMISSLAGKEPVAGLTISNALRAGLHGLMNTLSKELGPLGITVNAVLPSYTKTDRLKQLGRDLGSLSEKIPVGRIGQPEEFGKLVTFLCSAHAGFISGQAIGFDGGSMAST